MATFVPPVTLYDLLLEAIQFGSDEEAYQAVSEALSRPPAQASKALRTLSHILPDVIRLRKNHLLQYLLQNGVTVIAAAVKMAAGLLYESAKYYLELLFAHGWDINRALSNTEPPVLSIALHDTLLTRWLLATGADPNAHCDMDYTPLSLAVQTAPLSIVELLLQYGRHCHNGHLIYYATQRANINETMQMTELLYQYTKPVDDILWQDATSYCLRAQFLRGTPLYYACIENKVPVALKLLDLGADPDKACMRYNESVGPTPREVAIQNGGVIAERLAGAGGQFVH
ncbi:hypothetical protein LTR74_018157 [Friedmanniomyces endolithicus]|nr:hypothetical protein LTR74_018157 [Friedmanniomyces endolithicus]